MRKIVIHLNDEVLGISIDDNASDKEIKEQVLKKWMNGRGFALFVNGMLTE